MDKRLFLTSCMMAAVSLQVSLFAAQSPFSSKSESLKMDQVQEEMLATCPCGGGGGGGRSRHLPPERVL